MRPHHSPVPAANVDHIQPPAVHSEEPL